MQPDATLKVRWEMRNFYDTKVRAMTTLRTLFIAVALSLAIAISIPAQDNTIYVQVDYMKPLEGSEDDYVWMENMIYKPIHKERINSGEIVGWYLYAVQYPRGTGTEYDYVTLTFYGNFSLMDAGAVPYEDIISQVHPDKSGQDIADYASKTRKLVKSEVFKSVARFPDVNLTPPQSVLIDFMKVTPANENLYTRMETEIWQPLHQERFERDHITSWGLYELLFPGGLQYPYTYATATGFSSWSEITNSWPEDIWNSVHPSASQAELEQRAHETRDLVRTEIWKLIDFALPERPDE